MADLHLSFDPVCPFAWMTSKWVRLVQELRAWGVAEDEAGIQEDRHGGSRRRKK